MIMSLLIFLDFHTISTTKLFTTFFVTLYMASSFKTNEPPPHHRKQRKTLEALMGIRQEQRERDKSKIASEVSRRATPPALKQTSTLLIQHGSRKKPNHGNNNPPGKTSHILRL